LELCKIILKLRSCFANLSNLPFIFFSFPGSSQEEKVKKLCRSIMLPGICIVSLFSFPTYNSNEAQLIYQEQPNFLARFASTKAQHQRHLLPLSSSYGTTSSTSTSQVARWDGSHAPLLPIKSISHHFPNPSPTSFHTVPPLFSSSTSWRGRRLPVHRRP
jgi:hypothetical protein